MTNSIDKLDIDLDGIGHTLSDNKLMVPVYQRSYAWEEKHVRDLYDDLFSAIRNSEGEYFIGSVVITSGKDRNEVVDGQQRLATTSILIAAIRDYFYENEDKERAEDLQNDYLSSRDRRSQEIIPNLSLNNNDHNFFYNHVILPPDNENKGLEPTRESHERIKVAYKTAKKSVANFVSTTNNPTNSLLDLCDFIDENLKIIIVKVPDHANAFTIFETLNDRGLELAISDLLKNFLLGQSEDRLHETQASWGEMYSLLESTENEDLVVTFIRHYWSSINGLTRERDLYNKIKRKITSKQRAIDLATNLSESAKIYVGLIDTSQSYWSDFSDEAKTHMASLNLFRMTQVRPLLLAIMNKFSKKEIESSLKFLVSASVRFLIHGGLGGGALETQYCERAKEINTGSITKARELKEKMDRVIPSDTQFYESFKTATVSKQYLARYYLMVLEKCNSGDDKPELIPNADISAVNLEHIIPKKPDNTWTIEPEEHKVLVNRIGNLAIMSTRLNSEVGNSNYESKVKHYAESNFILTNRIAEFEEWGSESINTRQDELAQLAVKAWNIS